jgi:hypothetical protein
VFHEGGKSFPWFFEAEEKKTFVCFLFLFLFGRFPGYVFIVSGFMRIGGEQPIVLRFYTLSAGVAAAWPGCLLCILPVTF